MDAGSTRRCPIQPVDRSGFGHFRITKAYTYPTMMNAEAYHRKQVVFIFGLNIDIAPRKAVSFPLTTFVPWAAFIQDQNCHCFVLEQEEITSRLLEKSTDNPNTVNLELAIQQLKDTEEIKTQKS